MKLKSLYRELVFDAPGTWHTDPKEEEPMKTKNKKPQPGDRVRVEKVEG